MEFRGLEITLISGKDLKDVNLISKMDVYAVVSIEGDSHSYTTQKQKTQLDKNCGPNPRWDQTFKFTLPEDSLQNNRFTLNIHLISDRALGDKEIGEVHVPIKELFDHQYNNSSSSSSSAAAPTQQNLVSYSVRTPNGKSKGTLNFSFKFADSMQAPPAAAKDKNVSDEPVMAYPASSGSSVPAPAYGGYHQQAYPYQHPATAAAYPPPQAAYGGYPAQQQGYGYGHGYPPPPQQGYGYGYQPPPPPPQQQYGYYGQVGQQKPKKNGNKNMALGIGAGLLGGLLIGDMISDVGDMGGYDAGFDDGFGF